MGVQCYFYRYKLTSIRLLGFTLIFAITIIKLAPTATVMHPVIMTKLFGNQYTGIDEEGNIYNTTEALKSRMHSPIQITKDGKEVRRDMSGQSYRLWANDDSSSRCINFETRFGIDLNTVMLVSYPGSGNTWIRYLIEAATGIFTGSAYNDKSIYRGGMLGELTPYTDGRTLTQKTHTLNVRMGKDEQGVSFPIIHLLRNPADALTTTWHYKNSKGHTGKIPLAKFKTSQFHKFVKGGLEKWEDLTVQWISDATAPVYVIYYEQLKENPLHCLSLLTNYLQVPVEEGRMDCIAQHLSGSFKRNYTQRFDPYTPEEKEMISNAVTRVHQLLKTLGFPDPPVYPPL